MKITKLPETGIKFVDYSTKKNTITFGDDELMVNLEKKQRDEEVTLDICRDYTDGLVCSVNSGKTYVAQAIIPARTYTDVTSDNPDYDPSKPEDPMTNPKTITTHTPDAFSMDNVELKLYEEE